MDYGTSETCLQDDINRSPVNYYLDYYTSEIPEPTDALPARVNYYLGYGNSETKARCVVSMP